MPTCFGQVLHPAAAIIHDRRILGVPDLIVEVLSPTNRAYGLETKPAAYARAGLPEYGIVDPQARMLSHYRPRKQGRYAEPGIHRAGNTMCFDCLPSLSLPVGALFEGSPDTTL